MSFNPLQPNAQNGGTNTEQTRMVQQYSTISSDRLYHSIQSFNNRSQAPRDSIAPASSMFINRRGPGSRL